MTCVILANALKWGAINSCRVITFKRYGANRPALSSKAKNGGFVKKVRLLMAGATLAALGVMGTATSAYALTPTQLMNQKVSTANKYCDKKAEPDKTLCRFTVQYEKAISQQIIISRSKSENQKLLEIGRQRYPGS